MALELIIGGRSFFVSLVRIHGPRWAHMRMTQETSGGRFVPPGRNMSRRVGDSLGIVLRQSDFARIAKDCVSLVALWVTSKDNEAEWGDDKVLPRTPH